MGKPCQICTDHASLKWLMLQPQLSRRQVRWLDFLSQFDLHIEHVPGKQNIVADALSCRADLAAAIEVQYDLLTRIHNSQQSAVGCEVQDSLKTDAENSKRNLMMYDSLVCRKHGTDTGVIVIPDDEALKQFIMQQHHDSPTAGHQGAYRMIGSLSSRYYWRGLYNDVKEYYRKCLSFQASKVRIQAPMRQLQPLPPPMYNFEYIMMDLTTHLPITDAGYDSACIIVDRLSKYVYFLSCNVTVSTDQLVQLFLANVVYRHGMPKRIISDRDPRFTLRFWIQLINSLSCQQSLSTPYHPEID